MRSSHGLWRFSIAATTLTEQGVCTQENAIYVSGVLSSWICLLGDSPLTYPTNKKPKSVLRSFFKEVTNTRYLDLVRRYTDLFDELTESLCQPTEDGVFCSHFIREFVNTPVFKEYHAFYRFGDPHVLRYLLTFLKFAKKAQYADASLSETAFRGWLEVEEELSCPTGFDTSRIVVDIATIMRSVLAPLDTSAFYPTFGPGAVSEDGVRGFIQKSCNLLHSPRLDMAFYRNTSYKRDDFDRDAPDFRRRFVDDEDWDPNHPSLDYSTLRFVPKDVTKMRSICMEPNSFMYHQQVVSDWLRLSVRDGLLGRYIHFDDQDFNRAAAVKGSHTSTVDTIDLSAASDRIRGDLVRQVFPREFLFFLLATRTSKVRCPDGTVRHVSKFAPMGSAVCFPVQSILFASVVIYAMMLVDVGWHCDLSSIPLLWELMPTFASQRVRRYLDTRVNRRYADDSRITTKYERPTVFGDDIICDSRVTEVVTYLLTSLGFVVNGDKSFTGSHPLRESCGVFAYMGEDVTPYAFKVKPWSGELNPSAYASLVDAVNATDEMGLRHVSSALLRILLTTPLSYGAKRQRVRGSRVNPVPFVSRRDDFGVYRDVFRWQRPTHLKTRWNKAYQRREYWCVVPRVVEKSWPTANEADRVENYLYLKDVRARHSGIAGREHFAAARWRPEETGLEGRWLPLGN